MYTLFSNFKDFFRRRLCYKSVSPDHFTLKTCILLILKFYFQILHSVEKVKSSPVIACLHV